MKGEAICRFKLCAMSANRLSVAQAYATVRYDKSLGDDHKRAVSKLVPVGDILKDLATSSSWPAAPMPATVRKPLLEVVEGYDQMILAQNIWSMARKFADDAGPVGTFMRTRHTHIGYLRSNLV